MVMKVLLCSSYIYGDPQDLVFRSEPWQQQTDRSRPGVEAMFTPTAAGLRATETTEEEVLLIIDIIDRAIRKAKWKESRGFDIIPRRLQTFLLCHQDNRWDACLKEVLYSRTLDLLILQCMLIPPWQERDIL
ncbi:hypothetical protein E2320_002141 [Naja naja]|nr:hypothetical protein E2320_002141 [Naja naja]